MIQQFNIEENLDKKTTKSINKAWILDDNKVFHLKSNIRKDYIRLAPEHNIENIITILAKAKCSEGYIIDPKGILLGKIMLPEILLLKDKSIPPDPSLYKKFLYLEESNSILESIELIKDFVGESVPVIDKNKNILGVISESDLFNQLLIAEKVRNNEELSIN